MLSLQEVLRVLGDPPVQGTRPDGLKFSEITTDSRSAEIAGALFVALRGERFDGHAFVDSAFVAGATGAIVSEPVATEHRGLQIVVPDALAALQTLANWVRNSVNSFVVAITGSVGKTTTKEMVAGVLAQRFTVLKSAASFNNHVGVPLTLLQLNDDHSHAVVEIGMNHPGEIAALGRVVEPDLAIITNIGFAHIEFLGSREAILAEKASLLETLRPGGTAIINGDDPYLRSLAKDRTRNIALVTIGLSEESDFYASNITQAEEGLSALVHFQNQSYALTLNAQGEHLLYAALISIATAVRCGMGIEAAIQALRSFQLPKGRFNLSRLSPTLRVIDDTYNASPDSVISALKSLGRLRADRKVVVLGEMRELGSFSAECHEVVGREAARVATELVAVGPAGAHMLESARAAGFPSDHATHVASARDALGVVERLLDQLSADTIVLVKGSRFMHTERVCLGLRGRSVRCGLETCTLYINCSNCPQLELMV
jgi:UDP-N-acetylmuramoyl-tripeptide--D-alanyl-D-alanine ligase